MFTFRSCNWSGGRRIGMHRERIIHFVCFYFCCCQLLLNNIPVKEQIVALSVCFVCPPTTSSVDLHFSVRHIQHGVVRNFDFSHILPTLSAMVSPFPFLFSVHSGVEDVLGLSVQFVLFLYIIHSIVRHVCFVFGSAIRLPVHTPAYCCSAHIAAIVNYHF